MSDTKKQEKQQWAKALYEAVTRFPSDLVQLVVSYDRRWEVTCVFESPAQRLSLDETRHLLYSNFELETSVVALSTMQVKETLGLKTYAVAVDEESRERFATVLPQSLELGMFDEKGRLTRKLSLPWEFQHASFDSVSNCVFAVNWDEEMLGRLSISDGSWVFSPLSSIMYGIAVDGVRQLLYLITPYGFVQVRRTTDLVTVGKWMLSPSMNYKDIAVDRDGWVHVLKEQECPVSGKRVRDTSVAVYASHSRQTLTPVDGHITPICTDTIPVPIPEDENHLDTEPYALIVCAKTGRFYISRSMAGVFCFA